MIKRVLNRDLPIGIFDSGVGGLTFYRALHERLPDERFVYLGDTARVPYGTKSLQTAERYAIENSCFLEARGIKDHLYVTDAAERFSRAAERFLGSAPSVLEAVEVWGHDELRTH